MNDINTEDTSISIGFPDKSELPIGEDGFPIAPEGIRVLRNGAGFNNDTKRMVYGPGTFAADPHAFNTLTAKEAHETKREKAEALLTQKIEEAMGKPADVSWAEGGATLYKEIVMGRSRDKYGGRERTDTWIKIGQLLGFVVDKDKLAAQSDVGGHFDPRDAGISMETLREVRRIMEARAKIAEADFSGDDEP